MPTISGFAFWPRFSGFVGSPSPGAPGLVGGDGGGGGGDGIECRPVTVPLLARVSWNGCISGF